MEIRIRSTGQVMQESEFRSLHKDTSFPRQLSVDVLNSFDADPVLEGPQASGGTVYQYSQRDGVEQIDDKWYTKYILGPVFADTEDATAAEQEAAYKALKDEEQAKSVRASRSDKLKESDWTQVADAPVDQAAWAEYRQALRDIPDQAGFPWTVDWPVQP